MTALPSGWRVRSVKQSSRKSNRRGALKANQFTQLFKAMALAALMNAGRASFRPLQVKRMPHCERLRQVVQWFLRWTTFLLGSNKNSMDLPRRGGQAFTRAVRPRTDGIELDVDLPMLACLGESPQLLANERQVVVRVAVPGVKL
jgi:hypothetical protein